MTVPNTSVRSGPYYPNGVTKAFPFNFRALDKSDVQVVRVSADGSVTYLGEALFDVLLTDGGGSAIFSSAPLAGDPLYVQLDPTFEQGISIENESAFLPEVITEALDRAAQRAIFLRDVISRAPVLPVGEQAPPLPGAAFRTGGKVLGFNPATGDPEVQGASAFKGDPGGNTMAIGTFSVASTLTIPVGTDRVATSGYSAVGDGGEANYVADPAVTPGYVTANPTTSFRSANGRGFRISRDYVARGVGAKPRTKDDVLNERIRGKSFGAVGDGSGNPLSARYATLAAAQTDYPNVPIIALTDRVDGVAIQAALEEAKRLALPGVSGGLLTGAVVELPEGRFTLSRPLKLPNGVQLRGAGLGRTIIDAQNFTVPGPLVTNYSDANDSVDFFMQGLSLHGGTHGVKIDSGAGGQVNRLVMQDVAMRLQTDKNFEVNRLLQLADFIGCIFASAPYGLYCPAWTTNAVTLLLCGFEDHDWIPLTLRSAEAVNMIGGRFEAGGNKGVAFFTGSISGTTLTVTSQFAGAIRTGGLLVGDAGGIAPGTSIRRQLSGAIGGLGTYEVSVAQTVSSRAMTNFGVTIDCDQATINDSGCHLSLHGVYIENTNRKLLRDIASKNGVSFDKCHFTQALDNNGFSADYECVSDGIVNFGSNNYSVKSVVASDNVAVSGVNSKLIGNPNIYFSTATGAVGFKSRRVDAVGSLTQRAVNFSRAASTAASGLAGILTVNILGFDGSTGAVVHASRRFSVNAFPSGGVLLVERLVETTVGSLAAATLDVQPAAGATATAAGIDIVVGNLNGSATTNVWWTFQESGMSQNMAEAIKTVCG